MKNALAQSRYKIDSINLDKIIEVAKGLYNICLERMVKLVRSWLLLEVCKAQSHQSVKC